MRYLYLTLLLFCMPVLLSAQHYVGLGGGGGTPNKIGLRLSLPVNIHLTRKISLQPELVYVEHGTSQILRKLNNRDYRSSQAAYLALPVLLKAGVTFEKLNIHLIVGPRFAYGIRLSANYLTDTGYFREKLSFDEAEFRPFDFGALFGVGLEKEINKNRKIFLEGRYYFGLIDLDREADRVIYPEGFYMNIGLLIPIGEKP